MGRIHALSPEEAHKIAAGEVVERPASVTKELLENALDAGANNITVEIKDGGRARIRVIDNGHGMDYDDMHACIQQHTTSKIRTCDELQGVTSFGFRGEALASISSVSTLTITSQETDAQEGYTITVEGGTITHEQITARSAGTDVIVDDLFYNVPARKKFLKKRETEWRAIYQLCLAVALSRPACGMSVTHDGRTILSCPQAKDYQERISQLHDQYFAQQFIACESHDEKNNISVSGVITHPEYHRYDRSMITCFVNNRWVKNYRLAQAMIKGYADILPPRRFPAGYLFITVPAEEVDINVHPRKEEVHFLHPRRVERVIEQTVRTTLEEHSRNRLYASQPAAPQSHTASSQTSDMQSSPFMPQAARYQSHNRIDSNETASYPSWHVVQSPQPHTQQTTPPNAGTDSTTTTETVQSHSPSEETKKTRNTAGNATVHTAKSQAPQQEQTSVTSDNTQSSQEQHTYAILGQINSTYIVINNDDGCTMIDQHAAHERVLYEQFVQHKSITMTQLLFPQRITMTQADCDRIYAYAETLYRYGIALDRFDTTNIVITAVPIALKSINWSDMLHTLISKLPDDEPGDEAAEHVYHDLCATMACKAAIKAGDNLSQAEMQAIVQQLYNCPRGMTCPHGRPTSITFSQYDLERKFKRSQ